MASSTWQTVLAQDPVMAQLIQQGKPIESLPHQDIYLSLLHSIIGQQLSTKVARVIRGRFQALFPEQYPAPDKVLSLADEVMRSVGLSSQKMNYIRNVASFARTGELDYVRIAALDDETLIKHLTQIKGVGRWTAEMILMFTLARPDVLPVDDLGIQNAIKKHYGLQITGKALQAEMIKIATSWQPFRTIACRYLWQSLDNE
jgi:DNA-3-methyladenine glycosylase II